jgi:hypothetical protein
METSSGCWAPVFLAWPCLSAEVWAAWVQAIGSVAAIVVTWVLTTRQFKESTLQIKRQRIEDAVDEIRALTETAGYIEDLARTVFESAKVQSLGQSNVYFDDLEGLAEIIEGVNLSEHPASWVAAMFFKFKQAVRRFIETIKQLEQERKKFPIDQQRVSDLLTDTDRLINEVSKREKQVAKSINQARRRMEESAGLANL